MLSKILKKIFGPEYIRRDRIAEEIIRARQSEAERINRIRDEQEQRNIDIIKLECEIEIDGLLAEINQLKSTVEETNRMRAEAETLYYKNQRYAKNNAIITAEMERKGQALLNNLSGFISGIKNVRDTAQTNLNLIERKK